MTALMREFKKTPVTISLLGLTSLIFVAMQIIYFGQASSVQAVFDFGGMLGVYVKAYPNQLWRLVTPIFVHFGWEHFFFNALTLYFVGQMAEQIWGSRRFLVMYILAGISGNALTMVSSPNAVAAGASTSLFGLFAAIVIIGYFGRNPYLKHLGRSYQILILINLVFNIFTPNVGIAGHLGGVIGGALLAICLPAQYEKQIFKPWQRILAGFGYFIFVLGSVLITLF